MVVSRGGLEVLEWFGGLGGRVFALVLLLPPQQIHILLRPQRIILLVHKLLVAVNVLIGRLYEYLIRDTLQEELLTLLHRILLI